MKKYAILGIGILAVGFVIAFKSRHRVAETIPSPAVEVQAPAESPDLAPQFPSVVASPVVSVQTNAAPPAKTIVQRLLGQDTNVFKLSPEQVQAFLAKNGTNAESLLAAFNVTSDKEYLREA